MSKKNKKFLSDLNLKLKYCFNKKSLAKNNIYLKKQIKHLKNTYLDSGKKYVILKNLSYEKDKIIKFSNLFGKTLAQDITGKKYLIVKPNLKKLKLKNRKKIRENLRYHQTNLGGSIHSDGPQLSVPPKYIIMGCLNQAEKGGSSIIVSMD